MKSSDPFDPDNLRIDPKTTPLIRRSWDQTKNGWVLHKDFSAAIQGMEFLLFPTEPMAKLAAELGSPELAVLIRLWQRWFARYRKNPVTLARTEIKGFKVSRWQKYRALKKLEKLGFISVEPRPGKTPIITLLWRPPKS